MIAFLSLFANTMMERYNKYMIKDGTVRRGTMESNIIIRNAKIEDAKEILNIYKYYVEHTSITFECETPSLEVFENRMRNVMQKYQRKFFV